MNGKIFWLVSVMLVLNLGYVQAQTEDQIAKFDAMGGLVDSVITEINGNIGIGTTRPAARLDVAGTVDASQYNIGGIRVVSTPRNSNTFVGVGAGQSDTTESTTNAFFGFFAGRDNTTGSGNAFFGAFAGQNNSMGNRNTFFGIAAGLSNTTESNNTFLGAQSNGRAGITNATALGAQAVVTQSDSVVLGNNASVGIGTSAPQAKLHVEGGDVYVPTQGNGIILRATDGPNCFRLTVNNSGMLDTQPVPCP